MYILCLSCFSALWSPAGKGLTSWLLFLMFHCVFVTFPCGILGQVWYLIVFIPDLCRLSNFVFTIKSRIFEVLRPRSFISSSNYREVDIKYIPPIILFSFISLSNMFWANRINVSRRPQVQVSRRRFFYAPKIYVMVDNNSKIIF